MRLDKFLKVSRLIKRREVAKQITDMGLVTINGKVGKPSSEVKIGDKISISAVSGRTINVEVKDIKNYTTIEAASSLYQVIE